MGRLGPKFEVERLEEEKKEEKKTGIKKKRFTEDEDDEFSGQSWIHKWAENPANQWKIKIFVYAQTFFLLSSYLWPYVQPYVEGMIGGPIPSFGNPLAGNPQS